MDSIRSRCSALAKASKKLLKSKLARLAVITVISALLVATLTGASIAKYAVIINDGDNQVIVYTSENQPETILYQQNIILTPYDEIEFDGIVDDKGTITIHRGKKVTITADGLLKTAYLAQGTVADALSEANVTVDEDDLINVALSEPVNADMDIVINRVEYQEVVERTEIPCEIVKIPTQTLKKGKTRTLSQGSNGVKETVSKLTLIDGEVVERELWSMEIVKAPVATRVLVGDPNAPVSQVIPDEPIELDANGNPVNYVKKVTGKATAYSALGRRTSLKPGHVAMDLSKFPRGTKLYIKTPNGSFVYGYSEVRDTGTALVQGKILVDLFFDSYRESCLFGAKTVDIYVLE